MKSILLFLVFIAIGNQTVLTAQNQLPPTLKSAIPERYKIISELYHKAGPFVQIDIGIEIPSKYGCSNNKDLWSVTSVGIGVMIIEDAAMVKMQEDMMPFLSYLPTNESHKPQIDPWDELIKYSKTNILELPGGRGAYYTWTRQCIQDDHDEIYGVSLSSMFGSQANKISVEVNGNIDAAEAISITKELNSILSKLNFQNL